MLLNPIEIPVLAHSETSKNAQLAGLDPDISELDSRIMIFYNISAIATFYHKKRIYTEIHANGDCFISPMDFDHIQEIIAISQYNTSDET
jgi:hypothetical protein